MTPTQSRGINRLLVFITIASLSFTLGRELIGVGHASVTRADVEKMLDDQDKAQAKVDAQILIRLGRIEDHLLQMDPRTRKQQ